MTEQCAVTELRLLRDLTIRAPESRLHATVAKKSDHSTLLELFSSILTGDKSTWKEQTIVLYDCALLVYTDFKVRARPVSKALRTIPFCKPWLNAAASLVFLIIKNDI